LRIAYLATAGSADPNRASLPLHLAANGSLEVGHDVFVILGGDATELLVRDTAEQIEAVGVPPVRELLAKLREHAVPVYVCKGCAVARGATDEDLRRLGGEWVSPTTVAVRLAESDRVVAL
jgi:predicted peroxiredoxin